MTMDNDTPASKADLKATSQELKESIQQLKQELKEYIDERTHDAETRLLRGFADYSDSAGIRFRKLEADVSNIDASASQRLGPLEKQMTDFKMRLIALEGAN